MEDTELSYPTSQRILGGVLWGSLWGGGTCGVLLALIPANSAGFFLAIMVLIAAMAAGISLYWNAARERCLECDTVVTITPSGGKCPYCGTRYRAENRKLLRTS